MNVPSSEELNELRGELRRLLSHKCTSTRVREIAFTGDGMDASLWSDLAEFGCAGVLVPEEHGGIGAGMVTACAFAMELGAHLAPVPFLTSAVLVPAALTLGQAEPLARRWLPELAAGRRFGTVALTGPSGRATLSPDVRATAEGDGLLLNGMAGFVPDAGIADLMIVAVRAENGPVVAAVELPAAGVSVEPLVIHDRTRRLSHVRFHDVRVDRGELLASGAAAAELLEALYLRAGAVRAADAAGGARRVHEMAVAYAKERRQFGRPIGSFQAVKHKLADMHVRVEGASAAAIGAAEALDTLPPAEARRRVALTTSFALEAYVSVAGDAIQVHGGIGYTWEHDCHLFFKRAQLDEALLGDAAWHREQAAAAILSGV